MALYALIVFVLSLAAGEGFLRVQQALGPFYDLKIEPDQGRLHHGHERTAQRTLEPATMYGAHSGFRYTVHYDALGIRLNRLRPEHRVGDAGPLVLFMGDSFMEGYDDANTIPQHVWRYIESNAPKHRRFRLLNAGCSSYSPVIFVTQAKKLIPAIKPEFVVLDVDETDIGDDWFRYRGSIVRDDSGGILHVRRNMIQEEFQRGFTAIRRQPLYLVRLPMKVYHTRVHMPKFVPKCRMGVPARHLMRFSTGDRAEVEETYAEEIAFFEANLGELLEYLTARLPSRERVLLLYHPHLKHMWTRPGAKQGPWNDVVPRAIARAAGRHQVRFYNATQDLRGMFGDRPQDYYWRGDIHFNFEGLAAYGECVAKQVCLMLDRARGEPKPGK